MFANFPVSPRTHQTLFSRFGTAFSGNDFWKGMAYVDMLFASVSRLIGLLSLFACSTLTITQHLGWCRRYRFASSSAPGHTTPAPRSPASPAAGCHEPDPGGNDGRCQNRSGRACRQGRG